MKNEIISNILLEMNNLPDSQIKKLRNVLISILHDVEIIPKSREISTIKNNDNDKYIEKFAIEKRIENLSDGSIRLYVNATKKFLDSIGKNFREITKDDVIIYLGKQTTRGLKANTVDNIRKQIKAFFDWALFNDYISKNPLTKLKYTRREEVKKVILTNSEIEEIRDACTNIRELAFFDLLLSTGLRVSELINLTVDDIDFSTGKIKIYAPKTKNTRIGFLDARSLKHITDYRNYLLNHHIYSNYLFVNTRRDTNGKYHGLSDKSAENILHNIVSRTTINKKVTIHTIRKTFASKLYKKNVKPMIIQYLLGHSDFSTTTKYYIGLEEINIQYELQSVA